MTKARAAKRSQTRRYAVERCEERKEKAGETKRIRQAVAWGASTTEMEVKAAKPKTLKQWDLTSVKTRCILATTNKE